MKLENDIFKCIVQYAPLISIDFLIEKVKKLFTLIETHDHDSIYVKKEDLEVIKFIKTIATERRAIDYKVEK